MKKLLTIAGIIVLLSCISFAFNSQDKEAAGSFQKEKIINSSEPGFFDPSAGALRGLKQFFDYSGFNNVTAGYLVMILVGLVFIFLAIRFGYEPLLLIPIGTGILIGNIPFLQTEGVNLQLGIYQEGSVSLFWCA